MKVLNHFIICDNRKGDDIYEMSDGSFVWRYWEDHYNGQMHWNDTFKKQDLGELFRRLTYRYEMEKVKALAGIQPFYWSKPLIDIGIEKGYKKSDEQKLWESILLGTK